MTTTTPQNFSSYKNGLIFEERARRHLLKKGYKIIKSRYKTHYGEIDIIAEQKYTVDNRLKTGFNFQSQKKRLIFVEVKSRANDELIESILRKSQVKRIKNCASYFLAQNQYFQNHDIRFDFILFEKSKIITHFEDYF